VTTPAFALIHGAGDVGWYWHLVEAELRERSHDTVAPDLPCDDDAAGLAEYADTVVRAIGERSPLVVVAQSLEGFTAPLVCERVPVALMVLVAPMIPVPGEAPNDYWSNTGYEDEVTEKYENEPALFYQDVPPELASEALRRGRTQSEARMGEPSPLEAWPDVPTRVLLCRDDRLFPPGCLRRVARDRLGIAPDELDGGHIPALSPPEGAGGPARGLRGRGGREIGRSARRSGSRIGERGADRFRWTTILPSSGRDSASATTASRATSESRRQGCSSPITEQLGSADKLSRKGR
jgi:pimeloyl-ACP methyl ester carboxylesterase